MSDPEKVGELLFFVLVLISLLDPIVFHLSIWLQCFFFKIFFVNFILKHLTQLIYFGGTKN